VAKSNTPIEFISPYENIVIGNFLFGLGASIGLKTRGKAHHACVNLLQQTPLDPKLGDVLLTFPGTVRLLEFKRSENQSRKELGKIRSLRVVMADQPHLESISRTVHWYIESGPSPAAPTMPIRLCPYLDMDSNPPLTDLAKYVDLLASQALTPSPNEPRPEQISAYLACIGDMAGASSAATGGMLVHVSPDGRLSYAAIADLRDLVLQRGYLLEQQHRLEHAIGQHREAQHGPQRTIERDLKGPKLGG
jgi:hypothetical protein